MTNRVTSLAEEAEKLPVPGRIQLAVHLLATLDKPEPDIDAAWAEEGERRPAPIWPAKPRRAMRTRF